MKVSFDTYCEICDMYEDKSFEKVCDEWFPSKKEIDSILCQLDKPLNLELAIWLLETATDEIKEEYEQEYDYLKESFEKTVEFV